MHPGPHIALHHVRLLTCLLMARHHLTRLDLCLDSGVEFVRLMMLMLLDLLDVHVSQLW